MARSLSLVKAVDPSSTRCCFVVGSVYVAFDVLRSPQGDLRNMPLQTRKTILKQLLRGFNEVLDLDGVAGLGTALFRAICELDLEGIVAKRLADPYGPDTKWFKILNRAYSQKESRGELFERRLT